MNKSVNKSNYILFIVNKVVYLSIERNQKKTKKMTNLKTEFRLTPKGFGHYEINIWENVNTDNEVTFTTSDMQIVDDLQTYKNQDFNTSELCHFDDFEEIEELLKDQLN